MKHNPRLVDTLTYGQGNEVARDTDTGKVSKLLLGMRLTISIDRRRTLLLEELVGGTG